jgi:hypothetical protein
MMCESKMTRQNVPCLDGKQKNCRRRQRGGWNYRPLPSTLNYRLRWAIEELVARNVPLAEIEAELRIRGLPPELAHLGANAARDLVSRESKPAAAGRVV